MNRILIVDDEALLLQSLDKALKGEGHEVRIAETGGAALAEISDYSYQLCFLDIYLPDLNGVDVMKQINAISPKTKVVMMTSGTIAGSTKETIERDAYLFIPKPFDLLQIKMLTKRILEEKGL